MGGSDEFVTIETYLQIHEAEMAKAHLEGAGIEARIVDEHIVGSNPLLANAVGGIKLQVAAAREDEALEALEQMEAAGTEGGCLSCGKPMADTDEKCPACGWSYLETPGT